VLKTYSFCEGQNSQKPIHFIKVFKIPPVYAYKKPGATTPSPKFEPGYIYIYVYVYPTHAVRKLPKPTTNKEKKHCKSVEANRNYMFKPILDKHQTNLS
jgi:hypothetical protein